MKLLQPYFFHEVKKITAHNEEKHEPPTYLQIPSFML